MAKRSKRYQEIPQVDFYGEAERQGVFNLGSGPFCAPISLPGYTPGCFPSSQIIQPYTPPKKPGSGRKCFPDQIW